MSVHRVFVIGDSLFAETLTQLLEQREELCIVGVSTSVESAITDVLQEFPDVFVIAESNESYIQNLTMLLANFPDIPIVCSDLNSNTLQIFSNQRYQARTAELVTAITSLQKRS